MGGAFVLETLLTFVFVAVILLVTGKAAAPGFAGLAIGLSLTAVHLIGIPLTGTSVNPAGRSARRCSPAASRSPTSGCSSSRR